MTFLCRNAFKGLTTFTNQDARKKFLYISEEKIWKLLKVNLPKQTVSCLIGMINKSVKITTKRPLKQNEL